MPVPEFFKYGALASLPLFGFVELFLAHRARDFSFSKHTVSQTISLLERRRHRILFRLNFVFKALLDLGFSWYVIERFRISLCSPLAWLLILWECLFALLAWAVHDERHYHLHKRLTFASGLIWAACQIWLGIMVGVPWFVGFSIVTAVLPVFIGLVLWRPHRVNFWVQISCVMFFYVWMAVFVFWFL
jgi:hypothetical protein